jgi:hypothetical protein
MSNYQHQTMGYGYLERKTRRRPKHRKSTGLFYNIAVVGIATLFLMLSEEED